MQIIKYTSYVHIHKLVYMLIHLWVSLLYIRMSEWLAVGEAAKRVHVR